jgi:hypothetical protein
LERKARKGGAREGFGLENRTYRRPNACFDTALGRPDCGLVAESGTEFGLNTGLGLRKKKKKIPILLPVVGDIGGIGAKKTPGLGTRSLVVYREGV